MVNFTEANHIDDAIVVTVWGALLLYGLVANCLIQVGIYRNPTMRTSTSYWFIVSLASCDIVMISISLLHIIPATIFHDNYVIIMSIRNIWAIFLYDIFWYTGVLTLGLMALNRFISIVYPMRYQRIFSRDHTMKVICSLFTVGLSVSVPTLFSCCHTIYDHNYYVTIYSPEDSWYFIVDLVVNAFTVILMLFCYSIILVKVRHSSQAMIRHRLNYARTRRRSAQKKGANASRKAVGEHNGSAASCSTVGVPKLRVTGSSVQPGTTLSRREMRLFLQFFFVSLVFLLTWSTWQWLPRVSASKWVYFTMTSFFFINNAINPTVYLIFNSTLRREVRTVLNIEKGRASAGNRTSNSPSKEIQKDGPSLKPSLRQKFPSCAGEIGRKPQKQGSFISERIPLRAPSAKQLGVYHSEAAQCLIRSDTGTPRGLHNATEEQFSPLILSDFGSPDALLGASFREFLSPETLQDDSSSSSSRLSKEPSGGLSDISKRIAAHQDCLNDSLANLISPITLEMHEEAEEPLAESELHSNLCAIGNPVYTDSPKIKVIQVSTKPQQDGTSEVTINLQAPSENTDFEQIQRLTNFSPEEYPWVEEEQDMKEDHSKAPLVAASPLDEFNECTTTIQLVPVYSPDEELFIYTSTV